MKFCWMDCDFVWKLILQAAQNPRVLLNVFFRASIKCNWHWHRRVCMLNRCVICCVELANFLICLKSSLWKYEQNKTINCVRKWISTFYTLLYCVTWLDNGFCVWNQLTWLVSNGPRHLHSWFSIAMNIIEDKPIFSRLSHRCISAIASSAISMENACAFIHASHDGITVISIWDTCIFMAHFKWWWLLFTSICIVCYGHCALFGQKILTNSVAERKKRIWQHH